MAGGQRWTWPEQTVRACVRYLLGTVQGVRCLAVRTQGPGAWEQRAGSIYLMERDCVGRRGREFCGHRARLRAHQGNESYPIT